MEETTQQVMGQNVITMFSCDQVTFQDGQAQPTCVNKQSSVTVYFMYHLLVLKTPVPGQELQHQIPFRMLQVANVRCPLADCRFAGYASFAQGTFSEVLCISRGTGRFQYFSQEIVF